MNIVRKDIDQNNATISISIQKADYAEKVEKSLRDYRKKAQMPGFRPGMVPLNLIKKMYGKSVLAEEINNQIADNLSKYIEENEIPVLGQPMPSLTEETEIDFDLQEDFDFHFDIGIAPKFDVELSDKIQIPYYEISVSDEMIENRIKSHTSRFGKHIDADTVEAKDIVKGDLKELEGGQVLENGVSTVDAMLTPEYLKDEDSKQLFIGKKVGDIVVFNPSKAFGGGESEIASFLKISKEDLSNTDKDFQFEIKNINRFEVAAINQELFDKVYGEGTVKSEEEFRAKNIEDIKADLINESKYRFEIDARETLLNQYKDLEFPKEFLKRWILESNDQYTPEKVEEEYPKMIQDLTWQLIKDKVAKANEVKVEMADIEAYAKKVTKAQFAQYGMVGIQDEMLEGYAKEMLKDENHIRNFYERAAEEKIVDIINQQVSLDKKEISIEDFGKLFEAPKA